MILAEELPPSWKKVQKLILNQSKFGVLKFNSIKESLQLNRTRKQNPVESLKEHYNIVESKGKKNRIMNFPFYYISLNN